MDEGKEAIGGFKLNSLLVMSCPGMWIGVVETDGPGLSMADVIGMTVCPLDPLLIDRLYPALSASAQWRDLMWASRALLTLKRALQNGQRRWFKPKVKLDPGPTDRNCPFLSLARVF